ncbi:hypothetical protein [uncultured Chitinophaga sp.]|uniref:hypothetical protein n=1 Tax=uncultured Chitinophaga sp. TaxID=339340 RepID=UPI0025E24DE6|nr:hypothetical protein [uncultured Chitinophaga sp.]
MRFTITLIVLLVVMVSCERERDNYLVKEETLSEVTLAEPLVPARSGHLLVLRSRYEQAEYNKGK